MTLPYLHSERNGVEPLKNYHLLATKAYKEKQDYIVDGDPCFLVYYPIATKVVYGTFEGIPCLFHIHAHFWVRDRCYEVGVFTRP